MIPGQMQRRIITRRDYQNMASSPVSINNAFVKRNANTYPPDIKGDQRSAVSTSRVRSGKYYSISIVAMFKNNESYIPYFEYICSKLDNAYDTSYYILENNSTDLTKEMLRNFMKKRKGHLFSDDLSWNSNYGSVIKNERGAYMARLRNELKGLHGDLKSDYTIIIDSDIYFTVQNVQDLISKLSKVVVMSTPYTMIWDRANKGIKHYYDSLAFITLDGISHKDNGNRCMFSECSICYNGMPEKVKKMTYPVGVGDVIVESAFGGLVAINTDVYNKVKWEETVCEHHGFCDNVREHGQIMVSRNIECMMANTRSLIDTRSEIIMSLK